MQEVVQLLNDPMATPCHKSDVDAAASASDDGDGDDYGGGDGGGGTLFIIYSRISTFTISDCCLFQIFFQFVTTFYKQMFSLYQTLQY